MSTIQFDVKKQKSNIKKFLAESDEKKTLNSPKFQTEESDSGDSQHDSIEKKLRFGGTESDVAMPESKGMRFEYGRCPRTCEKFLNIEDYSKIFVEELTEEALG